MTTESKTTPVALGLKWRIGYQFALAAIEIYAAIPRLCGLYLAGSIAVLAALAVGRN
ncbi:hypothetical protein [Acidovorax sp. 1608163]|uniref:hypothetical protein n=1 Tax=Acidovorax sp. 1608163 TaxID=2478662 RepID=UPI0013CEEBDA|nr:hypothetical protein [Acidovorax sp. 1608163]